MAQVKVKQADGEISITPGGIGPMRTYAVKKGLVDVDETELAEFLQLVDGAVVISTSNVARQAAAQSAADAEAQRQKDATAAAAAAEANKQAILDANAEAAARAAAENKKTPPAG